MKQAAGFCPLCNRQVLVGAKTPNHVLHAIITLFSCALWAPVWIFLSLVAKDWRCQVCGNKARCLG